MKLLVYVIFDPNKINSYQDRRALYHIEKPNALEIFINPATWSQSPETSTLSPLINY